MKAIILFLLSLYCSEVHTTQKFVDKEKHLNVSIPDYNKDIEIEHRGTKLVLETTIFECRN